MSAELQLVSPFPRDAYRLLFAWMRELPECNFDDGGPQSADELAKQCIAKQQAGEKVYLVVYRGQPVGAIGYAQVTPEAGIFRGICFTSSVHGSGVPLAAVRMVLEGVFAAGTETVVGVVFADNFRVRWFLNKLGALAVASELKPAMRNGLPVRMRAYRIRADDFSALHGHQVCEDVPHAAGVLGGAAR